MGAFSSGRIWYWALISMGDFSRSAIQKKVRGPISRVPFEFESRTSSKAFPGCDFCGMGFASSKFQDWNEVSSSNRGT